MALPASWNIAWNSVEAATRGWDEYELCQLAWMWSEESGASGALAG